MYCCNVIMPYMVAREGILYLSTSKCHHFLCIVLAFPHDIFSIYISLPIFLMQFAQIINYIKSSPVTMLRVSYYATLGVASTTGGECRKVFVTFNGKDCANPAPIDWIYASRDTLEVRQFDNSELV